MKCQLAQEIHCPLQMSEGTNIHVLWVSLVILPTIKFCPVEYLSSIINYLPCDDKIMHHFGKLLAVTRRYKALVRGISTIVLSNILVAVSICSASFHISHPFITFLCILHLSYIVGFNADWVLHISRLKFYFLFQQLYSLK